MILQHAAALLVLLCCCACAAEGAKTETPPALTPKQTPQQELIMMQDAAVAPACSSEQQIVQCGQLLAQGEASAEAYAQCCRLYQPFALPPAAAAAAAQAAAELQARAASMPRPDLDQTAAGRYATPPDFLWNSNAVVNDKPASTCVARGSLLVPVFPAGQQVVVVDTVTAPLLTTKQISSVKTRALARTREGRLVRRVALRLRRAAGATSSATYLHPSGVAGVNEIALMQSRLNASTSPQTQALSSLLSGAGVPPKYYRYDANTVWNPPLDTPNSWSPGPYPMAKVSMKWSGIEESTASCPANYPTYAPRSICGHISAIEMDAQMCYKQALAYRATKDVRYAQNAFAAVHAWASTNRAWGMPSQNGPLESAWASASFARSLEMLRGLSDFKSASASFLSWFNTYLKPQMVTYIDVSTQNAVNGGNLNVYGNWHASIAEAFMAVAVLSDDTALFSKAVALFKATTTNYLRWGKGAYAAGRTVGECTETLRDVYHSQFGFGGLLQTAELAWQQNIDLYSTSDFALVAAMELHARIINAWDAGKNEALLPQGFKFFDVSMPPAPTGTTWVFDMSQQLWTARSASGTVVSTLRDGYKYLLGVKKLSTAWESGYNHYAGRLGIRMPETAALLSRYPLEHYEFHWGATTLTHADTAYQLWRPGLGTPSLCV